MPNTVYLFGMIKMFVFSGQLCAGKDHVAEKAGLLPISIAEPIYRISEHYLGTSDKTIPEIRRFLQVTGLWGRGGGSDVKDCCGVSSETMQEELWTRGAEITGMNMPWADFAKDKDFWLKGTVTRAMHELAQGKSIAVVNARFDNEINMLRAAGAKHYHVMCDETNRRERMKRPFDAKIDMEGTEKMAYELTQRVLTTGVKSIAAEGAIWNDQKTPCPIPGALTVEDFLAIVAIPDNSSTSPLKGKIAPATDIGIQIQRKFE